MDNSPTPGFQPIEREEEWEERGWTTEPIPLTVDPELGAMISIRLDSASLRLIDQAAKATGLTWTEFVTRAALDAAQIVGEEDPPAADPANSPPVLNGSTLRVGRPRRSAD